MAIPEIGDYHIGKPPKIVKKLLIAYISSYGTAVENGKNVLNNVPTLRN